jgi:hypothetical protein
MGVLPVPMAMPGKIAEPVVTSLYFSVGVEPMVHNREVLPVVTSWKESVQNTYPFSFQLRGNNLKQVQSKTAFRIKEIPIYFFNRKDSEGMETLFGNGSI